MPFCLQLTLSGPATGTVRSRHHSNDAGCSKAPFLRQTVDPDSAARNTPLRSPHPPGSAAAGWAVSLPGGRPTAPVPRASELPLPHCTALLRFLSGRSRCSATVCCRPAPPPVPVAGSFPARTPTALPVTLSGAGLLLRRRLIYSDWPGYKIK